MAGEKAVLFVDLLGFASLTEAYPIDIDGIKARDRPLAPDLDIDSLLSQQNPLTEIFSAFHRSLKWTIDMAKMRHPLSAITFSDSAFVATTHLFEAVEVAVDLVKSLLPQHVPVRIGIAYGSFEAIRFRSDVTVDGGDHAAHFLGTGVVRSYTTEKCGLKGIRILLHSSVSPLLTDPAHNHPPVRPFPKLLADVGFTARDNLADNQSQIHYLDCSSVEQTNHVGVRFEIDYWHFNRTEETKAWHALQDMWDAAPQHEKIHYEATAGAINRMRIKQGKSALGNLRCRTLLQS